MPITVERLPDQPILVATYTGQITLQDVKGMYEQSGRLAGDISGAVYRISDTREAKTSLLEILRIARVAADDMPGSTSDPRIHVIFVGTNEATRMMVDVLRQPQYVGKQFAIFRSMEEALASIEYERSKAAETTEGQQSG
jgi:hypothetical protein